MTVAAHIVTAHILDVLADEQSITDSDRALGSLVRSLALVDVQVTVAQVREALDAAGPMCPSAFGDKPRCSKHYAGRSVEWRLRQPEKHRLAREAITAVYNQTDRIPRIYDPKLEAQYGEGNIFAETVRPAAWHVCIANLRLRWLRNDFTLPRPTTIQSWFTQEAKDALAAA